MPADLRQLLDQGKLGAVRPLPSPAAGGDGAAVTVLSLPDVGADLRLVVQLRPPTGAAKGYKATALVEVSVTDKRGAWTFQRTVACQAGAQGATSIRLTPGTQDGDALGGFVVPLGAGVKVQARTLMAPAAVDGPQLLAVVVPHAFHHLAGPNRDADYGGLPVNAGPGAGPWQDLGVLPLGCSRALLIGDSNLVNVRLVSPDLTTTVLPIVIPATGLLEMDPFPAGLHLQGQVAAVSVAPTPLFVTWS